MIHHAFFLFPFSSFSSSPVYARTGSYQNGPSRRDTVRAGLQGAFSACEIRIQLSNTVKSAASPQPAPPLSSGVSQTPWGRSEECYRVYDRLLREHVPSSRALLRSRAPRWGPASPTLGLSSESSTRTAPLAPPLGRSQPSASHPSKSPARTCANPARKISKDLYIHINIHKNIYTYIHCHFKSAQNGEILRKAGKPQKAYPNF